MSLFSAMRMASNTLRADQIAMQVIGQNIANANTPGYIREETALTPGPTQRKGGLLLGLGVRVEAIVQKIDLFLEERLRGAVSDQASAESRESAYVQLEQLVGELGDSDISTAMTSFFNSLSEVLNQPEDVSVRNLAVLNGATLTQQIQQLSSGVAEVRDNLNTRIEQLAGETNRLIDEVRDLNMQIAQTEGGDASKSDAVGLRDRRLQALEGLAKIVDIRIQEQPSGTVTVYAGGDFLVSDGEVRHVKVAHKNEDGVAMAEVRIEQTDSLLPANAGELHGVMAARDEILGGFLNNLDTFAATFTFEFNKVYSAGQGLNGYKQLTSEFAVPDAQKALNDAGLAFEPTTGSFQVISYRTINGQKVREHTTDVYVDLTGQGHDTTLADVATALDGIDGVTASITADGKLTIATDSPEQEIAFSGDTSGLLAALGLNTFFTGSNARTMGVNAALRSDPAKLAASQGGLGTDTKNAVALAGFIDRPLASQNNASLSVLYDRLVGETTQGANVTKATAEGARVFEETLRGQKTSISGVSLDEEAVQLIQFQKSFQASSRFIAVLQDLFDMLVKI